MPYYPPTSLAPLVVESANVVAQRNGTTAQTLNVYNTYTDASNYERGQLSWSGNVFFVANDKAGTGAARTLNLYSTGALLFTSGAGTRWQMDATGNFLTNTDNAIDIGASGATRPRSIYVGTSVVAPAAGWFKSTGVAVASLPSAATAGAGARAFVTDASAPTFGATVAGAGAVNTPVYSDGANWKVG